MSYLSSIYSSLIERPCHFIAEHPQKINFVSNLAKSVIGAGLALGYSESSIFGGITVSVSRYIAIGIGSAIGFLVPNPFEAADPQPPSTGSIDIQSGASHQLTTLIRNACSLGQKLFFLNSRINSGNVSPDTIAKVRTYLDQNGLNDVAVSVDQYKPQQVWKRTFTNPKTSRLSKCTVGIWSCLMETFLFPKYTGLRSDHYNFSSNSIHLFSDDLAIALHTCAQAKDYNERKHPTVYTLAAKIPYTRLSLALNLYQEFKASSDVLLFLKKEGQLDQVKRALKVLIPEFTFYIVWYFASWNVQQCTTPSCMIQNTATYLYNLLKYVGAARLATEAVVAIASQIQPNLQAAK